MDYLIDSHIFLWSAMSPERLGQTTVDVLQSSSNRIFVSVITYWELSLKFGLGKLELKGIKPEEFCNVTKQMGFKELKIHPLHASTFYQLPREKHKDPFDRMIIWQAIHNDLTLISRDLSFSEYSKYGLKVHFAG